ncbi:glucose dehydrogenase-like [FAD: quinone] [Leptotrombidium deliense]|uniref:Glucose dehydrogenase-like [FAD: quinone] n=1 Tax=Leptotrombidium deliense TaxID=299467 RepID=A0A443RSC0_9ACAR|nr:glucose dehydrogenase-like [FAD: quinone] [Leptotrombidium deliense]
MNASTAEVGYERISPKPIRACEHFNLTHVTYWHCIMKQVVLSIHYPVASGKMGAVVGHTADLNLKEIGVNGLRVMDASVMPNIISLKTIVATMMIAKKGVDMLIKDNPRE